MSRPNPSGANDAAASKGASGPPRAVSSQMQAVMRLMTGQEERTLAQKLADPNRPTWEQYKKDNEDKLNLEGVDQKKMEEYRQQLDAERDKFLARGTNHKPGGGKAKKSKSKKRKRRHQKDDDSSDSDSDESSDDDRRRKKDKKRKKKHKKRHRRRDDGSDDSEDDDGGEEHGSSEGDDSGNRKRKHKSSNHKKKKKKKRADDSGNESEGSHYRLSKFFQGSDASE